MSLTLRYYADKILRNQKKLTRIYGSYKNPEKHVNVFEHTGKCLKANQVAENYF